MVLSGPIGSPLRQTCPEVDFCSIWADWLGEHTGQNKTELRRTGRT